MATLNKDLPFQTSIGFVSDDEPFYYQDGHQYTRYGVWITGPEEPAIEVEEPVQEVKTAKAKKAKTVAEPAVDDQDLI